MTEHKELWPEAAWCEDCTWHAGGRSCDKSAEKHHKRTGHAVEVEWSSVTRLERREDS